MNQPYDLKISDFRKEVLSSSKTPRKQFKKAFAKEIKQFIQCIFDAFKYQKQSVMAWNPNDKRNFWVEKYLQNAIDDLLCSVNHLISGYMVASGNLSRQFCESCAMAMIISNPKMKYYEKHFVVLDKKLKDFERCLSSKIGNCYDIYNEVLNEMSKIQVNQSIQTVWDNQKHFNINSEEWKDFTRIRNYYNNLSHPSVYSLGKIIGTSKGVGKIVFGSYYNPDYEKGYRSEIDRKISQAKTLKNIIEGINDQLINTPESA